MIGGGDFSRDRIIPDCIRAVEAGKTIEVRNPTSTRPYQFVLEPLFVYLLIAQKQYEDASYSGFYNVGPDEIDAVTTGGLVDSFCKKWGGEARWQDHSTPGAPHEAGYLSLDNHLLKTTFGWSPVYHLDEALNQVIEWEKAKEYGGSEAPLAVMKRQIDCFSRSFLK